MNEWISVKDKLPASKSTVIIKNKHGKLFKADFYLAKNNEPYFYHGHGWWQPTHWMPLPQAPE